MKYNKIVSLLSIVLLLSVGKNTFSMNTFSMRKALSYISCGRIAPSTSNLLNSASQLDEKFIEKRTIDIWTLLKLRGQAVEFPFDVCCYGIEVRFKNFACKITIYNNMKKEVFSYNHDGSISCVCFSLDKNYIALGTCNGTVKVFDIKKNKCVCYFELNRRITAVQFYPVSKRLIAFTDGLILELETSEKFQNDQIRYVRKARKEEAEKKIRKKQYEIRKKWEKTEKQDKQERIEFIRNHEDHESGFSIKFVDGKKVNVFKSFLDN